MLPTPSWYVINHIKHHWPSQLRSIEVGSKSVYALWLLCLPLRWFNQTTTLACPTCNSTFQLWSGNQISYNLNKYYLAFYAQESIIVYIIVYLVYGIIRAEEWACTTIGDLVDPQCIATNKHYITTVLVTGISAGRRIDLLTVPTTSTVDNVWKIYSRGTVWKGPDLDISWFPCKTQIEHYIILTADIIFNS